MEDFCMEECAVPIFKFLILYMYKFRLVQLGAEIEGHIHTTRLKIRILSVLPDLRAHMQWRDILFTFLDDIGGILRKACDHDSDVMHLARAGKLCIEKCLRESSHFIGHSRKDAREMLYHNHFWFGEYNSGESKLQVSNSDYSQ